MFMIQQKGLAERQKEIEERKKKFAEQQKEIAERKKKLAEYKNELAELEQAYQEDGFQFYVVCGPEGIGKTILLQEFCGWKRRIFFKATGNDITTLKTFAERVLNHYEKQYSENLPTWESVFKYIADNEKTRNRIDKRLVLILHEFPDNIRRDDQFMNMFKDAIDKYLSKTNIMLIVSNSDTEFVQKYFLYESALLHNSINDHIYLDNLTLDDNAVDKIADEAIKSAKGITNPHTKIQRFSADDVILREGETNDVMYKIITGSAVCWFKYGTDDEYVLASLAAGNCFGEYSVLTGNPSIYTVVAFSDMLVMKITKEDLITFVEMNTKNAVDIMENMARMLNVMAMNIEVLRS